jgi:putative FmdB family regulatory protein
MPIYEYFCPKCEKEFELMRPISQSGESAKCPSCGAKSEKLVSVFASKENYTIKVPAGSAYRGRERSAGKPATTKKK